MSEVQEKAEAQAMRHAQIFFDDDENSWDDMLEKYAEVANRSHEELKIITERHERRARVEEADWADYYYYDLYQNLLAHWITNIVLSREGYKRDKHDNWVLKNQPPIPPKKKFGFWG